jgi:hypothetical protein
MDAVHFGLDVQKALLLADWPEAVLEKWSPVYMMQRLEPGHEGCSTLWFLEAHAAGSKSLMCPYTRVYSFRTIEDTGSREKIFLSAEKLRAMHQRCRKVHNLGPLPFIAAGCYSWLCAHKAWLCRQTSSDSILSPSFHSLQRAKGEFNDFATMASTDFGEGQQLRSGASSSKGNAVIGRKFRFPWHLLNLKHLFHATSLHTSTAVALKSVRTHLGSASRAVRPAPVTVHLLPL